MTQDAVSLTALVNTVIRDDVRAISAYDAPSAEGFIKLDAMENPYSLPPELAAQLGTRLAQVALNRYPLANPLAFKERLARAVGMPDSLRLMIGNGSDELIHLVIQACARPGAVILAPAPSFVMYDMSARFNGCKFVGVPLNPDFTLDRAAMLAAIATHRPAVVFVAWPNNPTGNLFGRAGVEEILAAAPGLVVVDEAYLPFAQDTWMPQVGAHVNLVVLRTLSKLGLAGIRLGYLAGAAAWIDQFEKVRPPYNVNALTLATADFMLDHLPLLDAQAATLRSERDRVMTALRGVPAVTAFDSAANFILLRIPDVDAVFAALKARGILVKNASHMHPLLAGCLRVSIGTPAENDAFLAALNASLS